MSQPINTFKNTPQPPLITLEAFYESYIKNAITVVEPGSAQTRCQCAEKLERLRVDTAKIENQLVSLFNAKKISFEDYMKLQNSIIALDKTDFNVDGLSKQILAPNEVGDLKAKQQSTGGMLIPTEYNKAINTILARTKAFIMQEFKDRFGATTKINVN